MTSGININDFDTFDQNFVTFTRMNCFVFKEVKFLLIDLSNTNMFIRYHDRGNHCFVQKQLFAFPYEEQECIAFVYCSGGKYSFLC